MFTFFKKYINNINLDFFNIFVSIVMVIFCIMISSIAITDVQISFN